MTRSEAPGATISTRPRPQVPARETTPRTAEGHGSWPRLMGIAPLFPRTPITPPPAACQGMEGCPPALPPAPSHTLWKTLRVSHSQPATTAATIGQIDSTAQQKEGSSQRQTDHPKPRTPRRRFAPTADRIQSERLTAFVGIGRSWVRAPHGPPRCPPLRVASPKCSTSNLQHFAGIVSSATRGWCPAPRTEPKRSELPARTLLYVANAGGLAGLDSSTSRMFRQKRR